MWQKGYLYKCIDILWLYFLLFIFNSTLFLNAKHFDFTCIELCDINKIETDVLAATAEVMLSRHAHGSSLSKTASSGWACEALIVQLNPGVCLWLEVEVEHWN